MPISPLFSFPPGLLGYLKQKVGGAAPDKFGDTLLPSMEVGDLYGLPENVLVQNAAAVIGPVVFHTVPANERWLLLGYSVVALQAAAGGVANVVLWTDQGANSSVFWMSSTVQYTGGAAGGNFGIASPFPAARPLVIDPGSRFGMSFLLNSTFPGAWIMDATVRIYRMPI